jgi:hypothetical protein
MAEKRSQKDAGREGVLICGNDGRGLLVSQSLRGKGSLGFMRHQRYLEFCLAFDYVSY